MGQRLFCAFLPLGFAGSFLFIIFAENVKIFYMKKLIFCAIALITLASCGVTEKVYYAKNFGILPGTGVDVTAEVCSAIEQIKLERDGKRARLVFEKGDYDFFPGKQLREYYISNHDQNNPKSVAVVLEKMKNFTLDGSGSSFHMNGRMLPLSMIDCEGCAVENLSIDTRVPQITQVEILENDVEKGLITYRIAPYVNYRIENRRLVVSGSNWEFTPSWGIAFDGTTKHLIYRTSDIGVGASDVEEIEPRVLRAAWRDARLVPGSVVAMRSYARPTPGIFLYGNKNTTLKNITVHYAEGMGLLAQVCENITLDCFSVALREGDGRYFTTQADATHFSGCKGHIRSVGGLYEGMMDDAINVHGTYLRITKRIDDNTVVGRYMHGQSYGFYWGAAGDDVQFVKSSTMEVTTANKVTAIEPYDTKTIDGVKEFKITFASPVAADIANGDYGVENLKWTPTVYFAGNTIRNNRARGALFSTPQKVVVEKNLFDHTSGTAILLCGDCNGWFETGACRNVIIRKNRFVNSLTNMFQFTDGIISIFPEIPNLQAQSKYFHGGNGTGVVIEDNVFETFDAPIVYAKSLDGLVFRGNKVVQNNDFAPFHWNKHRFLLDRVKNVTIEKNEFSNGFDAEKDIKHRF